MVPGEIAKVNSQEISNNGKVLHINAEENWETVPAGPILKTTGLTDSLMMAETKDSM